MTRAWKAMMIVTAALLSITVLGSGAANAQKNWPQFRGPGSAGVSEETGLPDRWSATENIVWRTAIPGRGWSCPIVWGDRVIVTTAISEGQEEEAKKGIYPVIGDRNKPSKNRRRWMVLCFDLEKGGLLWQREVHSGFPDWPRHIKNSYASETPCTDGERVYAYFGNVGMFAFALDGTPVWNRRWERRKTRADWGSAASPIVYQGRVYLVNDNEGTREKQFGRDVPVQPGLGARRLDHPNHRGTLPDR